MSYLESVSGELVLKALDLSLQNHRVIANNIANVNVEGYKAMSLNFEEILANVRDAVSSGSSEESLASLVEEIDSKPVPGIDELATSVALDEQMVELAKNSVHYQALLQARSSYGEILSAAIGGGKR